MGIPNINASESSFVPTALGATPPKSQEKAEPKGHVFNELIKHIAEKTSTLAPADVLNNVDQTLAMLGKIDLSTLKVKYGVASNDKNEMGVALKHLGITADNKSVYEGEIFVQAKVFDGKEWKTVEFSQKLYPEVPAPKPGEEDKAAHEALFLLKVYRKELFKDLKSGEVFDTDKKAALEKLTQQKAISILLNQEKDGQGNDTWVGRLDLGSPELTSQRTGYGSRIKEKTIQTGSNFEDKLIKRHSIPRKTENGIKFDATNLAAALEMEAAANKINNKISDWIRNIKYETVILLKERQLAANPLLPIDKTPSSPKLEKESERALIEEEAVDEEILEEEMSNQANAKTQLESAERERSTQAKEEAQASAVDDTVNQALAQMESLFGTEANSSKAEPSELSQIAEPAKKAIDALQQMVKSTSKKTD